MLEHGRHSEVALRKWKGGPELGLDPFNGEATSICGAVYHGVVNRAICFGQGLSR